MATSKPLSATRHLEFRQNGDLIFVWLMVRAKGAGSGISMEQAAAHVWEYRDGKAISLTVSFDRDEALEAAGLSEWDAQGHSGGCAESAPLSTAE